MTKKLTAKSIRQGQTVHLVSADRSVRKVRILNNVFVCAYSTVASIIRFNGGVESNDNARFITYSRRKAISKAKELNRMMGDAT